MSVGRKSLFASCRRPFAYRFWRLYLYFRGKLPGLYAASGYARNRRHALWLAWGYAKKGSGRYV